MSDSLIRSKLLNNIPLSRKERDRIRELSEESDAQKLLRRMREDADLPRGQRPPPERLRKFEELDLSDLEADLLNDASSIVSCCESALSRLRKQFE